MEDKMLLIQKIFLQIRMVSVIFTETTKKITKNNLAQDKKKNKNVN